MLTRIVRMVFDPNFVSEFEQLFEQKSGLIRSSPGCQQLELWQDERHTNIFYTYSKWDSKADLDTYRQSDLFKSVWAQTKSGFVDRPQAWSTYKVLDVDPVG